MSILSKDQFNKLTCSPLMSESLSNIINHTENILLITDKFIKEEYIDYIYNLAGSRLKTVLSPVSYKNYSSFLLDIDYNNIEDYKFFGASAGRAPVLFHKSIFDYDLILVISYVFPDSYYGYHGSISTLFSSIAANKTAFTITKNALYDNISNLSSLGAFKTTGNPLYENIRDALITAGKALNTFAVNIPFSNLDKALAGDLFISQIETQKIFEKTDKYSLLYNDYQSLLYLLETNCFNKQKESNIFLDADLNNLGSNMVYLLKNKYINDIVSKLQINNYMEVFYACMIKYYITYYSIGVRYNKSLNDIYESIGLKPVK